MKKLIFSLLLCIIIFNFVSAEESGGALIGKQGNCIELPQECASCSYVTLTSIQYPNMSREYIDTTMTKQGTSFNYSFCKTNDLGTYSYCVVGDVDGIETVACKDFEITYLGKILSSAKAMMSMGFLFLLVLIFFLNFVAIGFFPKRNQTDEEGRILSITYLKYFRNVLWMIGYFLFIGIIYIASNLAYGFLDEVLLANTLFMIFKVAFGLAPLVIIVWLIWIFVSMFHDKQFQKMLNRGIFPKGNL